MFIAIGMPGMTEMIIILVIILIFFGVGKLPAVLGQMGKGVKAFKDGMAKPDGDPDAIEVDNQPSVRSEVTEAEELRR